MVHGEGGRSTGRCNDGFIGFREDDVSEAWFVEPPILQNHCNLMTASWEWKKLIAGYLFHPSRLKWLNKNPGEMADTIVSIGKCAYSYCIFVTFPFFEETPREMMESWLLKTAQKIDIGGRLTLPIANVRHPKQRLIFQDPTYLMSTRCWFWSRVADQPIATVEQHAFPSRTWN